MGNDRGALALSLLAGLRPPIDPPPMRRERPAFWRYPAPHVRGSVVVPRWTRGRLLLVWRRRGPRAGGGAIGP